MNYTEPRCELFCIILTQTRGASFDLPVFVYNFAKTFVVNLDSHVYVCI